MSPLEEHGSGHTVSQPLVDHFAALAEPRAVIASALASRRVKPAQTLAPEHRAGIAANLSFNAGQALRSARGAGANCYGAPLR